jgi:hypothetical protein
MRKKFLLSIIAVLGLSLLLATGAFAQPAGFDFASDSPDGLISFSGGNFSFEGNFLITHSHPTDSLHDFTGTIGGTYAIGVVGAGGLGLIAPVTLASAAGTNVFTVDDGATDFTALVDWVDISTSLNGVQGGLNTNAVVNLTDFSYAGANPDLLALLAFDEGFATVSWQFAAQGNDLNVLKAAATAIQTSYSGSVAVIPVPPAVWLFGSGLLGLAGLRFRKNRA